MKISSLHCKVINTSDINVTIDFDLSAVENSQNDIVGHLKKRLKEFVKDNKIAAKAVKVFTHNSYAIKFLGREFKFNIHGQKLSAEFNVTAKELVKIFNHPRARMRLLGNEQLLSLLLKDIPAGVVFREINALINSLRQVEQDSKEPCVVSCSSKKYIAVGNSSTLLLPN